MMLEMHCRPVRRHFLAGSRNGGAGDTQRGIGKAWPPPGDGGVARRAGIRDGFQPLGFKAKSTNCVGGVSFLVLSVTTK